MRSIMDYYLTTEAATLDDVLKLDLTVFKRIYLGNPFCMDYEFNLLKSYKELRKAIYHVKTSGAQAFVSLPAMPSVNEIAEFESLVAEACAAKADGLEIHSAGGLYYLFENELYKSLKITAGGFSNIYTSTTASFYKKLGATLLVPNYELAWTEISKINKHEKSDWEILVHGPIPLGLSENCLLCEKEKDTGIACPKACKAQFALSFKKWSLRNFGKVTFSGNDLCLLPQLPLLWEAGVKNYRITGLGQNSLMLNNIGLYYDKSLNILNQGKCDKFETKTIDTLASISKNTLCNGYFWGASGCDWIGEN